MKGRNDNLRMSELIRFFDYLPPLDLVTDSSLIKSSIELLRRFLRGLPWKPVRAAKNFMDHIPEVNYI